MHFPNIYWIYYYIDMDTYWIEYGISDCCHRTFGLEDPFFAKRTPPLGHCRDQDAEFILAEDEGHARTPARPPALGGVAHVVLAGVLVCW